MAEKKTTGLLVILTGPDRGKKFPLAEPVSIGRSEENEIVISDSSVSRRHAHIVPSGGVFIATDMGSRNKITAGGETVSKCELSPGDEFSLGNVKMKILRPSTVDTTPAPVVVPPPAVRPQGEVILNVEDGTEFEGLYQEQERTKRGMRRALVAVVLVAVMGLAAYAVWPMMLPTPHNETIAVRVNEGKEKAVAIWDVRSRVPRDSAGYTGYSSKNADVIIDSANGFIVKIVGKSQGDTEAVGINNANGKTSFQIVVNQLADALWEARSWPDSKKKSEALYNMGVAKDIEDTNPYEAMQKYDLAASMLDLIDRRPPEYARALEKGRELRSRIDTKVSEHVNALKLAIRAENYSAARAECLNIRQIITDPEDYRCQKARILYIWLKKFSREEE